VRASTMGTVQEVMLCPPEEERRVRCRRKKKDKESLDRAGATLSLWAGLEHLIVERLGCPRTRPTLFPIIYSILITNLLIIS
jgi:hypothetical protein